MTEAHGAVWTEAVAHAQSAALSEGIDSAESVDAASRR